MKPLILLFLLLTNTLSAEITWTLYDDEILEKVKSENKRVMVMITQPKCDACWFMKEIIFKKPAVSDEIAKNFVAINIDTSEDFVPDEFPYFATPTFYFLNTKGEIVERLNGAANEKDFLEFVHKVKQKAIAQ